MFVRIQSMDTHLEALNGMIFEVLVHKKTITWPLGIYLLKLPKDLVRNKSHYYGMWGEVSGEDHVFYSKSGDKYFLASNRFESHFRWFEHKDVQIFVPEDNESSYAVLHTEDEI